MCKFKSQTQIRFFSRPSNPFQLKLSGRFTSSFAGVITKAIAVLAFVANPLTSWAQSSSKGANVAVDTSAWNAILQASPIVQLTLLSLILLSILCWAVGYSKWQQLKRVSVENQLFLDRFWRAKSMEEIYDDLDRYPSAAIGRVFRAGYLELKRLAEPGANSEVSNLRTSNLDNLERTLRKAMDGEIESLESRLTVLATTGSTGPFIGLFGTVWGIMGSFHKIGATGNASLAVVAPGISEALVATAVGLAAAIPAVVLYNHFVTQVRRQETLLNNFAGDFLNLAKLNVLKDN